MQKLTKYSFMGDTVTIYKLTNTNSGCPRFLISWISLKLKAYTAFPEFGLKKYKGKDFGGCLVFQSYNVQDTLNTLSKDLKPYMEGYKPYIIFTGSKAVTTYQKSQKDALTLAQNIGDHSKIVEFWQSDVQFKNGCAIIKDGRKKIATIYYYPEYAEHAKHKVHFNHKEPFGLSMHLSGQTISKKVNSFSAVMRYIIKYLNIKMI